MVFIFFTSLPIILVAMLSWFLTYFSSPCGQDLVPCVLLSFDDEQILMWRGQDWKSMYTNAPLPAIPPKIGIAGGLESSGMHYKKEWDKSHCICTTFL